MENLLIILMLVSLVCFLLSWITPNTFSPLFLNKFSKGKIRLVFGIATIAFFIISGMATGSHQRTKSDTREKMSEQKVDNNQLSSEKQANGIEVDAETEKRADLLTEEKIPKYQIEYELSDKRYDGGKNYYVLIDLVDLTTDSFKNDIKATVKDIVKEKGNKISIDFIDDKDILDLEYKSHYGTNTLGRILNKNEMEQLGLHLVASFSGELETMLYRNQLDFFPATSKDNPKVGKYVEGFEFNPNN